MHPTILIKWSWSFLGLVAGSGTLVPPVGGWSNGLQLLQCHFLWLWKLNLSWISSCSVYSCWGTQFKQPGPCRHLRHALTLAYRHTIRRRNDNYCIQWHNTLQDNTRFQCTNLHTDRSLFIFHICMKLCNSGTVQ